MSKFSVLGLVLLVALAVVGFRGDARADKQNGDNNPKPGKGERYCPVHPSDEELAAMESDFSDRKAQRSFAGAESVAGGVINVYFHVINKGTGAANGDISTQMINDQMAVLNTAFNGTGWSFSLGTVDRTTNTNWYNGCASSSTEIAMKNALHKGSADDLNLYSCNLSGQDVQRHTGQRDHQMNVFANQMIQQRANLVDDRVEIEDLSHHHLTPAEGEQLAHQGSAAIRGALNLGEPGTVARVFGVGEQQLDTAEHDGQQIVEVVSHSTGEQPD